MAEKLNTEGISAELLVQDTRAAVHIARIASKAAAEAKLPPEQQTPGMQISREKLDDLRDKAILAKIGDATRGKVTGGMVDPIATLEAL